MHAAALPQPPASVARPGRVSSRKRAIPTSARSALTSAATFDWGSSPTLQRFAAAVLAPASTSVTYAINVDAASSLYWRQHWGQGERPELFLDGSPGKDALDPAAWEALARKLGGPIGSVVCNPPGIGNGSIVQRFWAMLEALHANGTIGSLFWIGFRLDQLRSLVPLLGKKSWLAHPLRPDVCTIFPGKRINYLAQPEAMIQILDKRMGSRRCSDSERARLLRRKEALELALAKGDDHPVPGPSPTHASYVSILWHHTSAIRKKQQAAARAFLAAEAENKKSAFVPYAAIGAVP
jgi:hypothetical protein